MLLVAFSTRRVGSVRQMTTRMTRPSGMFTKKIQCQPTVSVSRPPMAGPMRNATPNIAPKKPWYLPRSEGAKMSPMIASETGNSAPAPSPWMPRNRISCHISWDRPHRAEPIRKTLTPNRNTGRRPKRSDSFP